MRHIHLHIHRHRTFDAYVPAHAPKGAPGGTGGEFVSKGSGTTTKAPTTTTKTATTTKPKTSGHLPGSIKTARVKETLLPMPQDRSSLPGHIKGLRIPPAWTEVHYNPDPNGRCFVTGRDAKNRRQPMMNPKYSETRSSNKFNKIKKMVAKFPALRKANENNLNSRDPNVRQHAEALALIMDTGLRPGSERATGAEEQAYGATTLQGHHIITEGNKVYLRFVGKKGVHQNVEVKNKDVAKSLQDRAKKAGLNGKIFPSLDDNTLRRYSQKTTGYNPKDYRTLMGTSTAYDLVKKITTLPTTKTGMKKYMKEIATEVSKLLGNTPTIALKSYISPYVWSEWKIAA